MPRIMRIDGPAGVNASTRDHNSQIIVLEATSPRGRRSIEIDVDQSKHNNQIHRLETFLRKSGYTDVNIDEVLHHLRDAAQGHREKRLHFRVENLGFLPTPVLDLPKAGQSQEIEITSCRLRHVTNEMISQADVFVKSDRKINGLCALKIVSETLGARVKEATTEFVLGPASSKDEYSAGLEHVKRFRAHVEANTTKAPISTLKAFSAVYGNDIKGDVSGEIFSDITDIFSPACVHTSRSIPIRSLSSIMLDPQTGLFDEPRGLLKIIVDRTDIFFQTTGVSATPGKKLWETINLSIWMAACEGMVQPLLQGKFRKTHTDNKTMQAWLQFAGKNFFGTVPRFCAGDIIRSGALRAEDLEQLELLFASEDSLKNKNHVALLCTIAENSVRKYLDFLETIGLPEYTEIVDILKTNWSRVLYWIKRDLKSDFLPSYNHKRYPDDTSTSYGDKINTHKTSPSFAGKQYIPRRERLTDNPFYPSPVAGVVEFRRASFSGNSNTSNFFSRDPNLSTNADEKAWEDFQAYLNRLNNLSNTESN